MKSKKKIATIVAIALILLLLIPIPLRMNDGGSVEYKALLYSITDVKRANPNPDTNETEYIEGMIVEILGMQIYNNVD